MYNKDCTVIFRTVFFCFQSRTYVAFSKMMWYNKYNYTMRGIAMNLTETTKKSELIYSGRIFKLYCDDVELPNGNVVKRDRIEHHGGVCVLPIMDNGDVIFVRQFRYGIKELVLEIPAGKLELGEDHRECGLRELKEETGATCDEFIYLGECYPTTAYLSEKIHIYLAKGLHFSDQKLDDDEFLEVLNIPFDKALEMTLSGEIKDAKTQIALMKAKMKGLA